MSRRGVHPLSAQHTGGRSLETVGHMDPQPRDQSGSQSRGEQPTGAAASPQVRSSGNSSIQLFCSCFHHSNKRHGLIRAGGLGYPHAERKWQTLSAACRLPHTQPPPMSEPPPGPGFHTSVPAEFLVLRLRNCNCQQRLREEKGGRVLLSEE